jgi:hypothetical protein
MLCAGQKTDAPKNGVAKNSKAFCEGMAYRASATVLSVPVTDNPHSADSDAGIAWIAGWDVSDNAAGGLIGKSDIGCCAMGGIIVPA